MEKKRSVIEEELTGNRENRLSSSSSSQSVSSNERERERERERGFIYLTMVRILGELNCWDGIG